MPEKKLLSVAEIARRINVPESTVHYWKNRFARHLPSKGSGRQKRFKPQAVEIFMAISTMLKEGSTVGDVMERLQGEYPLNAERLDNGDSTPATYDLNEHPLQLASAMGLEIAKAVADGLKSALSGESRMDLDQVGRQIEEAARRIAETSASLESLQEENTLMKNKMEIMDQELVRIRRDRREMEKYLLDKIKSVTT